MNVAQLSVKLTDMASLKTLFTRSCIFKLNSLISRVPQNDMSQYPSYYVDPVFKKQKQEELVESSEIAKLTHIPIKAARVDQTCSILHDDLVRLFTNYVMKSGQKVLARDLVEKTFENVKRMQLQKYHQATDDADKQKIELNAKTVFYRAVDNCKPLLQLAPIKRGGVTYQVPIPITEKRSQFMSMKWLIAAAREKERTVHFPAKLAWELIEAANNQGRVVKRKQDLHRQCEANRAYAHYRWS